MTFDEYQQEAIKTAIYGSRNKIVYPTLGLCGEAGEVAEKIKKVLRDKNGVYTSEDLESIEKELGDVLWYIANIANDLELDMDAIAFHNIRKLQSRKNRNVIHGNGDNR
jgi:NTP pyrophosphatase (non-canonical NTP hydrolase)